MLVPVLIQHPLDYVVINHLHKIKYLCCFSNKKNLKKSNERIEEALKQLQQSQDNYIPRSRERVPKELSAIVHEVYSQLKEQSLDEPLEWDLTTNFNNSSNAAVNTELIQNVQALQTNTSYSPVIIRRALRIYFTTLKSRMRRTAQGKQSKTIQKQRRRQRMINKANSRKRALTQSTSLDDQTKKKLESVLFPDFMSSDESVIISDESDNPSDSENLTSATFKGKKLIKHVAVWRSEEFQGYIESLDRKLDRRRSARAKSMILPTDIGEPSERESPIDCPEWAKTIFD